MNLSPCPQCESSEVFQSEPVSAGGGHAPNFLPGLGHWYAAAKFRLVICRSCGLTRFFASPEALEKLAETDKWKIVSS